jgi:hypothetical protein
VTTLCGKVLVSAVYRSDGSTGKDCPKCFSTDSPFTAEEIRESNKSTKAKRLEDMRPILEWFREKYAPVGKKNLRQRGSRRSSKISGTVE